MASTSGLLIQGVVFTFFPLLAQGRGLTPADIGLVFLLLGLANTLARFPAGWADDQTGDARRMRSASRPVRRSTIATAGDPPLVTCAPRRDAQGDLSEQLRESRQASRPAVDPNIAVSAYLKRWETLIASGIKSRTLADYKAHVQART